MLARLPLPLLGLTLGALLDGAHAQGTPPDYAPKTNVQCPDTNKTPLIRVFTPQNQSLNANEQAYVTQREATVIRQAWSDWIGDGSALGYDLSKFNNNYSRVGIAVSGGGYRAAQYGAGVLSGLDARNDSAKAAGTGGMLQVTSYISALSGGSWLTGSLMMNEFPTVKDMVYGNGKDMSGWLLDLDLATPDGFNLFNDENQDFYGSILWSVYAKANAGIDTSITDPWARMISYHFLNQTSRGNFFTNDTAHGAGQLWSHIPQTQAWQNFQMPFPLICADSRPVGSNLTSRLAPDATVYEITPEEFGSWDPNLSAMANITYVGTHLNNGQPDNSTACVTGFDEAGFVMGTSASLFNQIIDFGTNTLAGFRDKEGGALLYVLARQLRQVRTRADDVANWPSPFNNLKGDTFKDSSSRWLELIDGSSNGENVPLGAQFVRARALDVVVAVDGSADLGGVNWPNGSSILFSQDRIAKLLATSHQPFPPIPGTPQDFLDAGVNMRPTFFGCDPKNGSAYPLLIYLPNSPPLTGADPTSNTGTFDLVYTDIQTRSFLDSVHANVLGGFTPNSNKPDGDFGKCLQCAALDRARTKGGNTIARSDFCQKCFTQYCFDPASPPSKAALPGRKLAFVDPDPQGIAKVEAFLHRNEGALIGGIVGLLVAIVALVGFLCWRRKRRQARAANYRRVASMHLAEEFEVQDAAAWQQQHQQPPPPPHTLASSREAQHFSQLNYSDAPAPADGLHDPFDRK